MHPFQRGCGSARQVRVAFHLGMQLSSSPLDSSDGCQGFTVSICVDAYSVQVWELAS
jgi:hypothetical protein